MSRFSAVALPELCKIGVKGKTDIHTTIIGICQALQVSADYLLFGEVTRKELSSLEQKISKLSSNQYQHLEEIVNNYIATIEGTRQQM